MHWEDPHWNILSSLIFLSCHHTEHLSQIAIVAGIWLPDPWFYSKASGRQSKACMPHSMILIWGFPTVWNNLSQDFSFSAAALQSCCPEGCCSWYAEGGQPLVSTARQSITVPCMRLATFPAAVATVKLALYISHDFCSCDYFGPYSMPFEELFQPPGMNVRIYRLEGSCDLTTEEIGLYSSNSYRSSRARRLDTYAMGSFLQSPLCYWVHGYCCHPYMMVKQGCAVHQAVWSLKCSSTL